MTPKASIAIIAGAATLAAATGVTYAIKQPAASPPETVSQTQPSTPEASPAPPAAKPLSPAAPINPSPSAPANVPSTQTSNSNPTRSASSPDSPTPAERSTTTCRVRMAIVKDSNPPLNVRSQPNTSSNVIAQLPNGTFVSIESKPAQPAPDGWFYITTPNQGWIASNKTEHGCNEKTERVQFANNATATTIRDRFIGTGSHQYRLSAQKGQTLTIRPTEGPRPVLLGPNGKEVSLKSQNSSETAPASGQLAETGDYNLVMESNFKGYPYTFEVEIR